MAKPTTQYDLEDRVAERFEQAVAKGSLDAEVGYWRYIIEGLWESYRPNELSSSDTTEGNTPVLSESPQAIKAVTGPRPNDFQPCYSKTDYV